jgi:shikimate dehydrogenase
MALFLRLMDRYVVIGNPVAHSLSPVIHARFAQLTGEALEYARLLVPPGAFAEHARAFFANGGRGANVTLPFKVDAFEFADEASERARVAGAANFLMPRGGGIFADNTDGAGLVADLSRNLDASLRGAAILLVGAGGAARGVVAPLLAEQPARLVIANRTAARARELARRFAGLGPIAACALGEIPRERFDIVLNATSTSTRGERLALPEGVIAPGVLAYDMAYGPAARAFVDQAASLGARASDGLGMLVEQAAESFLAWRGKRPPTAAVLSELRAPAA